VRKKVDRVLQGRGLRECYKVRAGERRSSARASIFEQWRNSLVSDTQESLKKLLGAKASEFSLKRVSSKRS